MAILLIISVTLLVAALLSGFAERSMLSTEVVFLFAGIVTGALPEGFAAISADDTIVERLAEVALFATLFGAGMRVEVGDIKSIWKLPGRALLIGMPLTALLLGATASLVAGISWIDALLIGAILSPTDPVFAEALVGRNEVPKRLRHLLNIESGINDGLVLPIVLVLIRMQLDEPLVPCVLLGEVALGIAIGAVVVYAGALLYRREILDPAPVYGPFVMLALALIIFSLCAMTHGNEYLGAFAGGITAASSSVTARDEYKMFGEHMAELLKVAAIFVFGALISATSLKDLSSGEYLFALCAVLIARPAGFLISMTGARLSRNERLAAAWFGPKGFASVVYGLLLLHSGIDNWDYLFHVVAMTVVLSIVVHSSTDVLMARRLNVENG